MNRSLMIALLAALSLLLVLTRLYPQVARTEVLGAAHYSAEEVLDLADIEPGDPLLWITGWRSRSLVSDPWIRRARIIRHWPNTVSVAVWERAPFTYFGDTVYAQDGTVLPGVTEAERAGLITLQGWGEDRTDEALTILRLLAPFEPQMLSYSPSGFDIRFAESSLYTPSADLLRAHWSGFAGQSSKQVAVYPWGVSVQP